MLSNKKTIQLLFKHIEIWVSGCSTFSAIDIIIAAEKECG